MLSWRWVYTMPLWYISATVCWSLTDLSSKSHTSVTLHMLFLFAHRTKYMCMHKFSTENRPKWETCGPCVEKSDFRSSWIFSVFDMEMEAKRPALHEGNTAAWTHIDSISCFVRAPLHCSIHWAARPGDKAPLDQLCDDPSGFSWSES